MISNTEHAIIKHAWDTANAARDALRDNPESLDLLARQLHHNELVTRETADSARKEEVRRAART